MNWVHSAKPSSDDRLIVSGSDDKTVMSFDFVLMPQCSISDAGESVGHCVESMHSDVPGPHRWDFDDFMPRTVSRRCAKWSRIPFLRNI